jgi:hypothetical protein
MRLTSDELTAASSAVAALAIVGGYLGVRSANRTAVTIAREERSARLASDLDALKRVAYSEFLVTLSNLADDQMAFDTSPRYANEESDKLWQRLVISAQTANDRLAQLALVAPQSIRTMAEEAFKRALKATEDDISAVAADAEELLAVMRADLGP